MAVRNIHMEAVDIVGAAHRRLAEVAGHISSVHPGNVDVEGVRRNLDAVEELMLALRDMQIHASKETPNGAEQRAQ